MTRYSSVSEMAHALSSPEFAKEFDEYSVLHKLKLEKVYEEAEVFLNNVERYLDGALNREELKDYVQTFKKTLEQECFDMVGKS